MNRQYGTLVELLEARAGAMGQRPAFTYLDHGGREVREETVSFAELHRRAQSIAVALREQGGGDKPVLLLFPPGLDYVAGFFGALFAGAIPVPAYPPHPRRLAQSLPRLLGLVADAAPAAVLTDQKILGMRESLPDSAASLQGIPWLSIDDLEDRSDEWVSPGTQPSSTCFLQYTSGSTSAPKGVMVTHRNLLANQAMIAAAMGNDESTVGVSWLPMYHDMGLIGHIIQPLYLGIHSVLMSPLAFLTRPIRWLRAVSRFRGTTSGGPNFAFELCLRRIDDKQLEGLDFSSWRVAYSGAEPVRPDTLDRFYARMAPYGLRREALFPCYGMAEATLLITGGPSSEAPRSVQVDAKALEQHRLEIVESGAGRSLALCGRVAPGIDLAVVDPSTLERAEPGRVGEIWIRGENVAAGYWKSPERTQQAFGAHIVDEDAGPYLRTGDLGLLHEEQLVVTGRLKDLLIVSGRNHYPNDLELTIEGSHPSIRPSCCAVFAVQEGDDEAAVAVVEVERRYRPDRRSPGRKTSKGDRRESELPPGNEAPAPARWDADEVVSLLRRAVWAEHELALSSVVLVKPGTVPKTSSGKIRRRETARLYAEDQLAPIVVDRSRESPSSRRYEPPATPAEQLLARVWRDVLGVERVGRDDIFVELGGNSARAAEVVWKVRELGLEMSLQAIFTHPSLRELARAATERQTPAPAPPVSSESSPAGRAPLAALDRVIGGRAPGYRHVIVRATAIDPERLVEAVEAVRGHHAELRRALAWDAEGPRWTNAQPPRMVPRIVSMGPLAASDEDRLLQERADQLAAELDPARGIRLGVEQLVVGSDPEGPSRLLFVADDAAVDGIGWRSLLADVDRAYRALENEQAIRLPPYVDVAPWADWVWQRSHAAPSDAVDRWMRQLSLPHEVLPVQAPSGETRWEVSRFSLGPARGSVGGALRKAGVNYLELFAASVLAAAHEVRGGSVRIGVVTTGRDAPEHDLARTVCAFESEEPLAVDFGEAKTAPARLALVRRHVARLQDLGVPFAALRHYHPDPDVRARATEFERAQLRVRFGSASARWTLPRLGYVSMPATFPTSPTTVELAAQMDGQELVMEARYSAGHYRLSDLQGFVERCGARLVEMGQAGDRKEVELLAGSSAGESELRNALGRALRKRKKPR